MNLYRSKFLPLWFSIACALVAAKTIEACGPDFPNAFLNRGDEAMLVAPRASFYAEMDLLQLPRARFQAIPATNGNFEQTLEVDLAELRKALETNPSLVERRAVLRDYKKARELLNQQINGAPSLPSEGQPAVAATNEILTVPAHLPPEFEKYFRGLMAYHDGKHAAAETVWKSLLMLPVEQRRLRTVWATYMLGRNAGDTDKAIEYFHTVRSLVQEGFPDSLGLAAASIGWEARVHWKKGNSLRAMELYVDQLAAGDFTALNSLHTYVVPDALDKDDAALQQMAAHPMAQRIITAYLTSCGTWGLEPEQRQRGERWLEAMEKVGVKDIAAAEPLALAAYQYGHMEQAERWLKRAPANSPGAKWLRAKLLLRAGKVNDAAALLASITKFFPLTESTNTATRFEETLRGEGWVTAGQQVLGELGVLHLQRREYTQALDALLGAGYWIDASYIAERVLSPEELKHYIDTHWPDIVPAAENESEEDDHWRNTASPHSISKQLRYLLARRLTRMSRGVEAASYFPPEMKPGFETLADALKRCHDETLPKEERAKAFWSAAQMVRTNGMELLGTESEPDWAIYKGNFDLSSLLEGGARSDESTNVIHASQDELKRAHANAPDPDVRYHYRFIAADLGWRAAE
ncbi:MAG: LysM domain protein, partial [Verrucomicrobiales bacterium]|nr:LysM domain protein [Verrucomicrobiales bacterium]